MLVAAAMAIINAVLWPVLIRVALPLTIITFGLGSLAAQRRHGRARLLRGRRQDALVLGGPGDRVRRWPSSRCSSRRCSTSTATLVICVSSADACAHARGHNRTDVPGVILFEIDGLGEGVLREAMRDGHVPTIARWLSDGTHRMLGWECDLSSQTGASQAGLAARQQLGHARLSLV